MLDIVLLLLPFFGLILLGFVAGRIWSPPEVGLEWLNVFVIYFALPALLIRLLMRTPIADLSNWGFVFSTTLSSYFAFALTFCIAIALNRGRVGEATMQGLLGAYANVGFMGPGLTLAVLGAAAGPPTALVFCFDLMLFFTLVPALMAHMEPGGSSVGRQILLVLKRIVTHPLILATATGVALAVLEWQPPSVIDRFLTLLGSAAAPCALFAMGVTIALRPLKRVPAELTWILTIKLMVHPLAVYMLLSWFGGFDPLWIKTAVLMASLPPAATTFLFARQYGTYIERSSSGIVIGTLASVASIPVIVWLLNEGILPS